MIDVDLENIGLYGQIVRLKMEIARMKLVHEAAITPLQRENERLRGALKRLRKYFGALVREPGVLGTPYFDDARKAFDVLAST